MSRCSRDCPQVLGSPRHASIFRSVFDLGDRVAWILRLVKIGAEGEGRSVDVMEIHRPDHLGNIADLGLALDEMKRLLAALQQEIVAAQVSDHAVRRPTCSRCGGGCRVKDYQEHVVATLFGRVTIRLPRFRCAACASSASQFGFSLGSNGWCSNGSPQGFRDGNGLIDGYVPPLNLYEGSGETELFWQDLSTAGFLDVQIPNGNAPGIEYWGCNERQAGNRAWID